VSGGLSSEQSEPIQTEVEAHKRILMSVRLVVLISGNGSNLQAILDACARNELIASVVAVISDKADAYGLVRADNAGVRAIHFPKLETESRRDYDARLAEMILPYAPNYIVLAGWMRILTSAFLDDFPNRVINLHPALPGMFPGTNAIERAYEAFKQNQIGHTGVMVHLVPDEGVDNGPVLASEVIPIQYNDTLESLETRVHKVEHVLLINALKAILTTKGMNGH
jgi:phosphoribosylglycinamide formyltransferase-1